LPTHGTSEEVGGGNARCLLLDFLCNETSKLSKKMPLPAKESPQLFGENVSTVEFECVSPWGSSSLDHALIYE